MKTSKKPFRILAFFGLITLFLFQSCVSSERLLEKGDYDAALDKSIKKVTKDPDKKSEIQVLKKAYNYAQQKDNERINDLRKTGQPNIWGNVFTIFNQMNRRQNKLKSIPYQVRNKLNIPQVNYSSQIEDARYKAAEYHFVLAQQLLNQQNKRKAREAYQELQNVEQYLINYKDVNELKVKALNDGRMFTLITFNNASGQDIPEEFYNEIEKINIGRLNSTWTLYDINKDANKCYDYKILISIQNIKITPELVKENNYTYDKEIQDGIQPKVNKQGLVVKDSLGEVIYINKYKTLYCYVRDLEQHKDAYVNLSVSYLDNISHQILRSNYLDAGFSFHHIATTANGDLDILPQNIRRRLGTMPLPFPHDFEMLMETSVILRDKINSYLYSNRNLIN